MGITKYIILGSIFSLALPLCTLAQSTSTVETATVWSFFAMFMVLLMFIVYIGSFFIMLFAVFWVIAQVVKPVFKGLSY